jgi:RNA polymerase sigma-70 factor (ECF subfamily)
MKRAVVPIEPTGRPPGPFDLEEVYRANAADVARWAARLGGPGIDPEDVVHEVFMVAQRRFPAFQRAGNVKVWLYRTTTFLVRRRRQRERWRRWLGGSTEDLADRLPAAGPTPLEALERARQERRLYQVLDQLPEKYRTVLVLFELDGRSGEEVVALTGRKVATLRVWLFRARALFVARYRAIEEEGRHG